MKVRKIPFTPNNTQVCVSDHVVLAVAPDVDDLLVFVMSLEWPVGLGRIDEVEDANHATRSLRAAVGG